MASLQVAVAIIHNAQNQLLFQERKKNPYKGHLGLVGGKVELDESRDKALVREIKEETLLDVDTFDYLSTINETLFAENETTNVTLHLYLVKTQGVVRANFSEGEVHWLDKNHFYKKKSLYIPTDWLIVDRFISGKSFFQEILVDNKGGHYAIRSVN